MLPSPLEISARTNTVDRGSCFRFSVAPSRRRDALPIHVTRLPSGAVLLLQLALGGWVSTNYATLACSDFPLCNGQIVPEMDWQHGFTLWRELGKTAAGHYLPFSALTAIHWVHRNFALVVATADEPDMIVGVRVSSPLVTVAMSTSKSAAVCRAPGRANPSAGRPTCPLCAPALCA